LIALAVALVAVVAALAAAVIYLTVEIGHGAVRERDVRDDKERVIKAGVDLATQLSAEKQRAEALDQDVRDKDAEITRETRARKTVEAHRDQLLQELARSGDPGALVSSANNELRALSELSGTTTAASSEHPDAVHGPATHAPPGDPPKSER